MNWRPGEYYAGGDWDPGRNPELVERIRNPRRHYSAAACRQQPLQAAAHGPRDPRRQAASAGVAAASAAQVPQAPSAGWQEPLPPSGRLTAQRDSCQTADRPPDRRTDGQDDRQTD